MRAPNQEPERQLQPDTMSLQSRILWRQLNGTSARVQMLFLSFSRLFLLLRLSCRARDGAASPLVLYDLMDSAYDALASARRRLWEAEYFSTSASDTDRVEIPSGLSTVLDLISLLYALTPVNLYKVELVVWPFLTLRMEESA